MRFLRRKRKDDGKSLFETRSHSWAEVGLAAQLSAKAARKARRQALILVPLLVGVLLAYTYRKDLFGLDMPIRIATVVALVILGWAVARDLGRAAGPTLFRRLDPATAGTVGFLIRLIFIALTVLVALRIAGLRPETLAVGGAFTAVIIGLAAQQTLGNLIAGLVLLSARPFRVGERVRFVGGGIDVEGVVSSLGLLYTTLASGDDQMMVPNSAVLGQATIPLREPAAVDLRVRLPRGARPSVLQAVLRESVTVPTRKPPDIALEELDGEEVIVRVSATPQLHTQGAELADEILAAMSQITSDHTLERLVAAESG